MFREEVPGLYYHGIFQWDMADRVIHVGYKAAEVWFYSRPAMLAHLEAGTFRWQEAYTGQRITAMGYCVPVPGPAAALDIPQELLRKHRITSSMGTDGKGAAAVAIVVAMADKLFPGFYEIEEVEGKALQIRGGDIIVSMDKQNIVAEVKCDLMAGSRVKGGTGNLYVQTHEAHGHG